MRKKITRRNRAVSGVSVWKLRRKARAEVVGRKFEVVRLGGVETKWDDDAVGRKNLKGK